MSETSELTIYTDGGSRGNPGPAAYAFVIQRTGEADIEERAFLGRTTNNIAEYTGLVKALEHARHLGATRLTIYSDSELMVKQMNGEYRVKNEGLIPLYEEATRLRKQFPFVAIRHIRREFNKQADRLCNEAMDHPEDAQPFPLPLPPREPDVASPAVVAAPANEREKLRAEGIRFLADYARQWARGDATTPPPSGAWDELWQLLVKSRVVRSGRKRKPRPGD
jgi:ribonuclease HI